VLQDLSDESPIKSDKHLTGAAFIYFSFSIDKNSEHFASEKINEEVGCFEGMSEKLATIDLIAEKSNRFLGRF
jgi:hypothetical protein